MSQGNVGVRATHRTAGVQVCDSVPGQVGLLLEVNLKEIHLPS